MAELLNRPLTPESINAAWKRLRREHTVWVPGLSRSDMDRDLASHLLSLADELRSGRYRPAPIRQFTISKADGRKRVLTALSLRDKLAQRAVLQVLDPLGEALFHNDSFGYRRRRNTEMACRRAAERICCGLGWLVDADIRSFFDEIPHRPLIKALKRVIPDRDMMRLLESWLAESYSHAGILTSRRGIA